VIILADYDTAWPVRFATEAARIREACGEEVIAFEHIGSTAVPGLAAKPVIDMMPGVADLEEARRVCVPAMQALGYTYVPEYEAELPERLFFRDGPYGGHRNFHVHMVETSSGFWPRHLAFRDWLRAHPSDARAYEALKRRLVVLHANDRAAYTDAKTKFVEGILGSALN
jgi:GrpB-like predicted nucleotidyltransferase (UPF0157 family)